jgi:hypothetical protein
MLDQKWMCEENAPPPSLNFAPAAIQILPSELYVLSGWSSIPPRLKYAVYLSILMLFPCAY